MGRERHDGGGQLLALVGVAPANRAGANIWPFPWAGDWSRVRGMMNLVSMTGRGSDRAGTVEMDDCNRCWAAARRAGDGTERCQS